MFNAMKYRKWGVQFDAVGDARFRIWAPGSDAPRLVINGAEYEMRSEGNGWYEAVATVDGHVAATAKMMCARRPVE